MSIYQKIAAIGPRYFKMGTLFKYGFNLSPMYRRSTGRVLSASDDLLSIRVKLPISYKNRNYVGSIFGGSMFAAVDPIPMVQLINILGKGYVVWDKAAEIFFKIPAREDLYADFIYTTAEIEAIKQQIAQQPEIEVIKTTQLTNKDASRVFCEVRKKIYIADKAYYQHKRTQAKG